MVKSTYVLQDIVGSKIEERIEPGRGKITGIDLIVHYGVFPRQSSLPRIISAKNLYFSSIAFGVGDHGPRRLCDRDGVERGETGKGDGSVEKRGKMQRQISG